MSKPATNTTKRNTNNNNPSNTEKKYNPTMTAMFPNDAFGDGAYLSVEITGDAFDVIQRNVQLGSRLLFKPRVSKTGRNMAYLEILPPRDGNSSEI